MQRPGMAPAIQPAAAKTIVFNLTNLWIAIGFGAKIANSGARSNQSIATIKRTTNRPIVNPDAFAAGPEAATIFIIKQDVAENGTSRAHRRCRSR